MAHFLLSALPVSQPTATIDWNLWIEGHGKTVVDAHFSKLSAWLHQAELHCQSGQRIDTTPLLIAGLQREAAASGCSTDHVEFVPFEPTAEDFALTHATLALEFKRSGSKARISDFYFYEARAHDVEGDTANALASQTIAITARVQRDSPRHALQVKKITMKQAKERRFSWSDERRMQSRASEAPPSAPVLSPRQVSGMKRRREFMQEATDASSSSMAVDVPAEQRRSGSNRASQPRRRRRTRSASMNSASSSLENDDDDSSSPVMSVEQSHSLVAHSDESDSSMQLCETTPDAVFGNVPSPMEVEVCSGLTSYVPKRRSTRRASAAARDGIAAVTLNDCLVERDDKADPDYPMGV
jgi:hypothetical protein